MLKIKLPSPYYDPQVYRLLIGATELASISTEAAFFAWYLAGVDAESVYEFGGSSYDLPHQMVTSLLGYSPSWITGDISTGDPDLCQLDSYKGTKVQCDCALGFSSLLNVVAPFGKPATYQDLVHIINNARYVSPILLSAIGQPGSNYTTSSVFAISRYSKVWDALQKYNPLIEKVRSSASITVSQQETYNPDRMCSEYILSARIEADKDKVFVQFDSPIYSQHWPKLSLYDAAEQCGKTVEFYDVSSSTEGASYEICSSDGEYASFVVIR